MPSPRPKMVPLPTHFSTILSEIKALNSKLDTMTQSLPTIIQSQLHQFNDRRCLTIYGLPEDSTSTLKRKLPSIWLTTPDSDSDMIDNRTTSKHPVHQVQLHRNGSRASFKEFTRRLSQAIIDGSVIHLKKIKESEILGSYRRETKFFSESTTVHGPLRVHQGKGISYCFWSSMVVASLLLLLLQIYSLVDIYFTRPAVSQVSFQVENDGVDFPLLTICSFNTIKKSYVKNLNITGDFPEILLDYILESNVFAPALYSTANRTELQKGETILKIYQKNHQNFTIRQFFTDAGFDCSEMLKLCSFGGFDFDCCSAATPILTDMGKCYQIDVEATESEWRRRQTGAGIKAGLQITLDSNLQEQFVGETGPFFSTSFETGFRYYVHDKDTIPYLTSEGISVSPGLRVESALTHAKYDLLSADEWGNCTDRWPDGLTTKLPYTAASCKARFRAEFFHTKCGCSPGNYDIEDMYPVCSPIETINCMDLHMEKTSDGNGVKIPNFDECKLECNSNVYYSFNSYRQELSLDTVRWFHKQNRTWTKEHIKQNFLTINVFFRDLSYTQYTQVQATSFTELLSSIGSNMGLFFSLSLIGLAEIILYLGKMGWIAFSKQRSRYMAEKKRREEKHVKELEETVEEYKRIKNGQDILTLDPTVSPSFIQHKHVTSCDLERRKIELEKMHPLQCSRRHSVPNLMITPSQ